MNIVRRNLIQVVKKTREKDCHIRETHTFECKVCDFKNRNKEELDTHILACVCPVYLQIQKTEWNEESLQIKAYSEYNY